MVPNPPTKANIVIIGAGFGGLAAAKALKHAHAHVTLIDRRNHHLFQPLLYQVATAGLAPTQIATPIRAILRKHRNTDVVLGDVDGVDLEARYVFLGAQRIPFDYLIVSTGARHSYFGHNDWERDAPGLKTLEDAIEMRKRILLAFERLGRHDREHRRATRRSEAGSFDRQPRSAGRRRHHASRR